MELINGGVYKTNMWTIVLVFFPCREDHKWGMLHINRHIVKGMSVPSFQGDGKGNYTFTDLELKEKYNSDDWLLLDGRLRIEKIDNMSLVDYARGNLESYDLDRYREGEYYTNDR